MNGEKKRLTLWIARASNDQQQTFGHPHPDFVTATYAYDQASAEQNLAAWFAQYPERPHHYFTEQPNGFLTGLRTWLPGHLPVETTTHKKTEG